MLPHRHNPGDVSHAPAYTMGCLLPDQTSINFHAQHLDVRVIRLCIATADSTLLCMCRMALCVQVYLRMDRVDKAEQQIKVRGGQGLHCV